MNILILGSELGGGFLCNSILAPDCWLMPLIVSPPLKDEHKHYLACFDAICCIFHDQLDNEIGIVLL